MPYLASDRVAVIDLATGGVEESPLAEELLAAHIGGAGVNAALHAAHAEGEPLVLGAGLLTGTLLPGASLGLISGVSPLTGSLVHAPLTLYAGLELKYSGFDYLVLKGRAPAPSYLWVHDGIADLEPAAELWDADVWTATRKVRQAMGDELIQTLVAGPAAVAGSPLGQVMINFWASGDRFGLGSALAAKNVKLVALRGMGLIEINDPEAYVAACAGLLAELKTGAWAGRKGLGDLAEGLGEPGLGPWLAPLAHRHRASFNTPFAANTFVFLEGDPAELKEPETPEPGVLLTDLAAPLGMMKLGLAAPEACAVIRDCAKAGLDAAGLAAIAAARGASDAAGVRALMAGAAGPVPGLAGPFSASAPDRAVFADFGQAGPDWWRRRMALAYVFGLDPVFALMSPAISEERLLELAGLGAGLELTPQALEQVLAGLLG